MWPSQESLMRAWCVGGVVSCMCTQEVGGDGFIIAVVGEVAVEAGAAVPPSRALIGGC